MEAAAACGHDYTYFASLDAEHELTNFETLDLDYLEVGFHNEVMKWIQESEIPLERMAARPPAQEEQGQTSIPEFEIGTTLTKFFPGHGNFIGTVTARDLRSGWYTVQYHDGDEEELDALELCDLINDKSAERNLQMKAPWSSIPGCQWNESCSACGDDKVERDDELLKCFFCPQVQHLNCIPIATGPKTDIPGEWLCPACSIDYNASKKTRPTVYE